MIERFATVARFLARAVAASALAIAVGGAARIPASRANEIVVGTHLDLSGPLSQLGTAVRNGLVTAFDEANASAHNRRFKLIAIDDGYNARKAIAATKTLLNRDHVFAVLCPVGTPPVAKTMPLVLNSGTLHLFPFTSVDDTYLPLQPLEFAIDFPVARQISAGLRALFAQRDSARVGVLYRNDRLGKAALKGAVQALAARQTQPVATESYAPGSLNFIAQLNALHDAGADIVVVGGVAQEAITAMQQAAARSWTPVFLCGAACYVPELPALGGHAVSGLYAVAMTPIPYPDDPDARLKSWVRRYEARFGTVASAQAFRAYLDARVFVEAVKRAGANLSERRVARALETMSPWVDPVYGGLPVVFSARDHIGFHTGFLAQVREGRWTTVTSAIPQR